jgi:hypothetical protein
MGLPDTRHLTAPSSEGQVVDLHIVCLQDRFSATGFR